MHCWNTYNNIDYTKKCTIKVFWHNVTMSSYEQDLNKKKNKNNLLWSDERYKYIAVALASGYTSLKF